MIFSPTRTRGFTMIKKFLLSVFVCLPAIAYCVNVNTYIPPQAYKYQLTIKDEINKFFPELEYKNYVPGLIEHESCLSLTHNKCWNPQSQLKTSRELGIGLGMLTKAYNTDGSIRFDKLSELRTTYKTYLKELSWETLAQRPDLQIRSIILMLNADYNKLYDIEDQYQRLAMIDAAYNGGIGGLQKERRQCGLTKGCNPNIWFDNVERMVVKSTKAIYGNRSAFSINRDHVRDTLLIRMPKYKKFNFID